MESEHKFMFRFHVSPSSPLSFVSDPIVNHTATDVIQPSV